MVFTVDTTSRTKRRAKAGPVQFLRNNPNEGELARVQLQNTSDITVHLLRDDYERLIAAGYGNDWYFAIHEDGNHDIRLKSGGNYLCVAKLILGVPQTASVSFLDQRCINLRRSNLIYSEEKMKKEPTTHE